MSAAEHILAITSPGALFVSPETARAQYIDLAKRWHPDNNHSDDAARVTAHINALWAKAEQSLKAGCWDAPHWMLLRGVDGTTRRLRFERRVPFELGEMVYGRETVAYLVKRDYADLFESAKRVIGKFKYANPAMEQEFARYLPNVKTTFETTDGRFVMVMEKTPDVFLLRDVLTAVGGKLDPRHVGWVMNTILNTASYLEWAALAHNDISPDTYFISPEKHQGFLYGGWWYARSIGSRLNALPARSMGLASAEMLRTKLSDCDFDLTLIRATGRDLLGDSTGMTLAAPPNIIRFLRGAPSESAREDYARWGEALSASFGARRFVKLEVGASDIFGKEEKNG